MKSFIATAAFAALASAFTAPTNQTYGALTLPDLTHPVTTGQTFTITWQPKQPADGVTVSLVLCKGPSTNCVIQSPAIVEGIAAGSGSYNWNVPCSLTPGTQNTDTGYGMLIIVDGTGEFQYSTQYSVLQGSSCSSSTTSSSSTVSSSSTSSRSSSSTSTTSGSSSSSSTSSSSNSNGWYGWSSTSVTTVTTTTRITPTPVSVSSTTYQMITSSTPPTSTSSAASSSSPAPRTFTGAAAVPTAFVNAAGLVGAAVLGMMAL